MPLNVKNMLSEANAVVPRITPEEAVALEKDGALIVDVRDAAELEVSGKIAGALHVSRSLIEFQADPESPAHNPEFRPERTIILYCASGARSALAGKTLLDLGFTDVRNLGSFSAWVKAGGRIEKPAGGDS